VSDFFDLFIIAAHHIHDYLILQRGNLEVTDIHWME